MDKTKGEGQVQEEALVDELKETVKLLVQVWQTLGEEQAMQLEMLQSVQVPLESE